jgi:hypothetical protein
MIADCQKTIKEQTEKLQNVFEPEEAIVLDEEKVITFEDDEEINLDEIN